VVQVYTGGGKGKTTAALGQALRALGHSWRVLFIQFMKGDPDYGEVTASRQLPGLEIVQSGLPTFVEKGNPTPEDVRLARAGLDRARAAIVEARHQMIVLDEINVAVDYGLLPVDEVLDLVRDCPRGIELVLTGRGAAVPLIEVADLVSDVREVKHPYQKGIVSREGIDY
jgi:cob(I)alamin adenosyltransferase